MGGVGKTELAIRYARQHEADYPGGVCWLNARDSNLAAQIMLFAQSKMSLEVPQKRGERPLNLKEQVEWCWQHWQPADGIVLVVLDDVTDLGSCRGVLPTANRFRVLMTTRLRRIDTNFVEISLDVLPADKALELLASVLGERDRRVQREPQTAEELCKWLGYLPLGLELVGRHLDEDPDLSLAEMLERLKATPGLQDEAIDPDEEQLQDTEMTAQRGVRAAFELSWQELTPITQCVGELLSLFTQTVIPWEIVTVFHKRSLLNWDEKDINFAKKQLYKLHLLQRIEETSNCYKIHPLIWNFLQAKLADSEQSAGLRPIFLEAIDAFYRKLAYEILEENINEIEEEVAKEFEQLEFTERWRHPREMNRIVDLDEITVTVDSVKTLNKSIHSLYTDDINDEYLQFGYELILEILFTSEGTYPDQEMGYYDSEEGEWCTLDSITEVRDQNTEIITVKVNILFDEYDPLETNEVEYVKLVVDEPIEVKMIG